jgi:hypothetical protein
MIDKEFNSKEAVVALCPAGWKVKVNYTSWIFEDMDDSRNKVQFYRRKGYIWMLEKVEGEVAAVQVAILANFILFMDPNDQYIVVSRNHGRDQQQED